MALDNALEMYSDTSAERQERAKAQITGLGSGGVLCLARILRMRDGNRLGALKALRDIETEDSLRVLIGAMNGDTRESRHVGAVYVASWINKYGWSSNRVRAVEGLVDAALAYLAFAKRHERAADRWEACRLVARLCLSEALPTVRELSHTPAVKVSTVCGSAVIELQECGRPNGG